MNKIVKDMLVSELEAKRRKAILSLHLLSNKSAGIGDHSTNDFYNNVSEALEALTTADDNLETLSKYEFKIEKGECVTYKNGVKL